MFSQQFVANLFPFFGDKTGPIEQCYATSMLPQVFTYTANFYNKVHIWKL
jgi:hypothetical protein